jgi:hypothetical protein
MSFCEHCQGQRFDRAQVDRAQVLRKLRETRRDVRSQRGGRPAEQALALAIKVVRAMEIPHLEPEEEQVVH